MGTNRHAMAHRSVLQEAASMPSYCGENPGAGWSGLPEPPCARWAFRPVYLANVVCTLAYTNRPLNPKGDAAAQGNVPKLLL